MMKYLFRKDLLFYEWVATSPAGAKYLTHVVREAHLSENRGINRLRPVSALEFPANTGYARVDRRIEYRLQNNGAKHGVALKDFWGGLHISIDEAIPALSERLATETLARWQANVLNTPYGAVYSRDPLTLPLPYAPSRVEFGKTLEECLFLEDHTIATPAVVVVNPDYRSGDRFKAFLGLGLVSDDRHYWGSHLSEADMCRLAVEFYSSTDWRPPELYFPPYAEREGITLKEIEETEGVSYPNRFRQENSFWVYPDYSAVIHYCLSEVWRMSRNCIDYSRSMRVLPLITRRQG